MKNFVALEKRTKKQQKEYFKSFRGMNGFNTGTRVHKDNKHPSRQKRKDILRRELEKELF